MQSLKMEFPFSVPWLHLQAFKKELLRLCAFNVLESMGESKWAHPSFIITKKDGSIHWVSNLHKLNKVIKQKFYPLPIIMDILLRHTGCKFFTKLDISMKYYTFKLNEESQELCIIITPFGKYRYKDSQWDSSVHLIFHNKQWRTYHEESTILKYILMTLDVLPMNGNIILDCWTEC